MFKSSISFITWQSPYYIYIYNLFVIFKIRLQLANKLSKLKEQAQEYAAPIMEELDPENLGYIERKRRTSRIDTSWEPESGADIRRFYDILRHLWKVWCCFCIHSIAHICCDLLHSVWDCCCRWDLIHSVRKQLHEEPLCDRDITLSGRFHSTIFQRVHN